MQMHRTSGGTKIHPENSEKLIEDAVLHEDVVLHNPFPHLYNGANGESLGLCVRNCFEQSRMVRT